MFKRHSWLFAPVRLRVGRQPSRLDRRNRRVIQAPSPAILTSKNTKSVGQVEYRDPNRTANLQHDATPATGTQPLAAYPGLSPGDCQGSTMREMSVLGNEPLDALLEQLPTETMKIIEKVEHLIGYRFKNKTLCIAALSFFAGGDLLAERKRLAVWGDRLLSFLLCRKWYQTGSNVARYNDVNIAQLSTYGLYRAATKSGIDESCLLVPPKEMRRLNVRHTSETVEAIVGAVMDDSDWNLEIVDKVVEHLGIFDHQFLREDPNNPPLNLTQMINGRMDLHYPTLKDWQSDGKRVSIGELPKGS